MSRCYNFWVQLRGHLFIFLILFSALASPVAFAQSDFSEQDLALPENPVQGKPGELKTDVPMDSLSIGNQEEENLDTSKAPAASEIPPPQTATKSQSVKKEAAPQTLAPVGEEPLDSSKPSPQTKVESDSENPVGDEAEKADTAAEGADSGSTMINSTAGDDNDADLDPIHPRNKICNCQFSSRVPYSERRTPWGGFLGVGAGNFSPTNYQPDFNPGTFGSYYDKVSPTVEMTFGLKYNFFLGSLSAQLAGGYFKATSSSDGGVLTLFPITVGLNFALDNLFKEPYVVPYVVLGEYSDLYNESVGGQTVKGNSPFSEIFMLLGVAVSIRWFFWTKRPTNSAYQDFGLENTFLSTSRQEVIFLLKK